MQTKPFFFFLKAYLLASTLLENIRWPKKIDVFKRYAENVLLCDYEIFNA